MNFETKQFEKSGEARKKLLAMEKEGLYVFHGSSEDIEELEPRQAFDRNKDTGKMEEDGEPAVFATPYADIAIFRALTNFKDMKGSSSSSFGLNEDGALHFSATENLLEHAKGKVGKVYVLPKDSFDEPEGMQVKSSDSMTPVEVVEVGVDDLANIKHIQNTTH